MRDLWDNGNLRQLRDGWGIRLLHIGRCNFGHSRNGNRNTWLVVNVRVLVEAEVGHESEIGEEETIESCHDERCR